MSTVLLSIQARNDLIGIKKYTIKNWGKKQSNKYIFSIRQCAKKLANYTIQGKLRNEIASNLRSYHIGRHVIFYVEYEEGIKIARILHDSMDFRRHI